MRKQNKTSSISEGKSYTVSIILETARRETEREKITAFLWLVSSASWLIRSISLVSLAGLSVRVPQGSDKEVRTVLPHAVGYSD